MSLDRVSIALVGIGGYGGSYVRELLPPPAGHAPSVRLVAGIDPAPERSDSFGAFNEAGVPIYADLGSFYREACADLVVIAAPIHLHATLTCEALSHDSHVLCEKPLCATAQEAAQMAEAQRRAGLCVAIGYQWSFSQAIQSLKRDITAGLLGRPLRFKTRAFWPRPSAYFERNDWAGRIRTPDGSWVLDSPVNNATAHYLHNMLYLLGETRETSAQLASVQAELYRANAIENYDTAALRCITEGGTEVLFYTAHPVRERSGPVAEFQFEAAMVRFDIDADAVFSAHFNDGRIKGYGNPDDDDRKRALWDAVDAVHSGEPVACGIEAATPHTLCVNGAQESTAITPFPAELVRRDDWTNASLTWVEGLQEALEGCYRDNLLPAERGTVPWAVEGKTIDLSAYRTFPSFGTA